MAAGGNDGSLKFDTKINTDGFEGGTSDLLKAAEKLTGAIEKLSDRMDKAFSGSGAAAVNTANDIDRVAEATRRANEELERMKKEKAATFTGTITNNNAPTPSAFPDDGKRYNLYGEDVDALIEKEKQLEASARATSEAIQAEGVKEEQSLVGFKDSMLYAVDVFKGIPSKIIGIFTAVGNASADTSSKGSKLVDEIDRLKDHLYTIEKKGITFGDPDYDKTYGALKSAETALAAYKKSLAGTNTEQKKTEKSARKMNSSLKKTHQTAVPLTKSILKLSNMFKLMLIRMSMRAIIQAAKEGFENLAQYSSDTNKSISLLISANTRLKNSFATAFAPILNVAAPALKSFIDLLSTGASYAGQFLAALAGKSTFVKAVDVEEDYAESLKESNKELKEKEKGTKKLAFAFDDLIQAQGADADGNTYNPPTPDQMFETVEVENDIRNFADTVKGIFADLFNPLKQSWVENGPAVTEAAKAAFSSLKILAGDVGESFLQVWKNEGYGKAITDDVLISVSNLFYTVSNLADGFDKAWKAADTGTSILRHMGDLLLIMSGFFRQASEDIRAWSAKLDFAPLLKSFDNLLAKFNPVVQKIGNAVLWLLEKALLPLAKWAIENGVPAVLDLIATGFEVFASVLNALHPIAMWLWNTFLQPLGKWAGEIFIEALKKITELLLDFSDWIKDNQTTIEGVTIIVLAFFAAFKFMEFVSGVKNMLAILPTLIGTLGGLLGTLNPITIVLGLIISAAALVARAWDKMTPEEKLATKIIAVAGAIGVLALALGSILHDPTMISMGAIVAAAAGISLIGISLSAMSGGSQNGYSSKVSSLASQGMSLTKQAIPRLATGTVVPPRAGEFAAILGDNNRDTEIVSPIPAMKQAFKEAIEEMGGLGGSGKGEAYLVINNNKFAKLVYDLNRNEKRRIGVHMITEG